MICTYSILIGYCCLIALHPYFAVGAILLHVSILALAAKTRK